MSPKNTGHGSRREHDGPSVGVFSEQRIRGGDFDGPGVPTHTERGEVAAVLAEHLPVPVFGCECTPVDDESGVKASLDEPWEAHVAAAIAPLIAAREQAARVEALREAADLMLQEFDRIAGVGQA